MGTSSYANSPVAVSTSSLSDLIHDGDRGDATVGDFGIYVRDLFGQF